MENLLDDLISAVTACEQATDNGPQEEVNRIKQEILDEHERLYSAMINIAKDSRNVLDRVYGR